MISFMADVIGIRDDMYIGKGNKYMHDVVDAVTEGHKDGILEQKATPRASRHWRKNCWLRTQTTKTVLVPRN